MGKASRDKGKRGELEARDMFRKYWGSVTCERTGQTSGKVGQDLVRAFPGWHVEIKRIRRIGAVRYDDQAREDSKGSPRRLVVMREDRGEWLLMLPFTSAKEFAQDLIEHLGGTVEWPVD
jgi:hypothetical protein